MSLHPIFQQILLTTGRVLISKCAPVSKLPSDSGRTKGNSLTFGVQTAFCHAVSKHKLPGVVLT